MEVAAGRGTLSENSEHKTFRAAEGRQTQTTLLRTDSCTRALVRAQHAHAGPRRSPRHRHLAAAVMWESSLRIRSRSASNESLCRRRSSTVDPPGGNPASPPPRPPPPPKLCRPVVCRSSARARATCTGAAKPPPRRRPRTAISTDTAAERCRRRGGCRPPLSPAALPTSLTRGSFSSTPHRPPGKTDRLPVGLESWKRPASSGRGARLGRPG